MAYRRKLESTLTPQQRAQLANKIKEDSEFRDAIKQDGALGEVVPDGGRIDTGALDARINHYKKILNDGTPEKLSGAARVQAEAEYKELGEKLNKLMLTRKEMDLLPRHGYEYNRAVRKTSKQEVGNPEFAKMATRYRALGSRIDPDNPESVSVEALRSDT